VVKAHDGTDGFCPKEINGVVVDPAEFARITLNNRLWLGRFNEFPVFDNHSLFQPLLGLSFDKRPQVLTRNDITDALAILDLNPDQKVFFNSLSAGASQNHFHSQGIDRSVSIEEFDIEPVGMIGNVMVNTFDQIFAGLDNIVKPSSLSAISSLSISMT